jgi:hypothetical protein
MKTEQTVIETVLLQIQSQFDVILIFTFSCFHFVKNYINSHIYSAEEIQKTHVILRENHAIWLVLQILLNFDPKPKCVHDLHMCIRWSLLFV